MNSNQKGLFMLEKKVMSPEVIEGQTAIELPDRHMLGLVKVTVVNNGQVVEVKNVDLNTAVQLCGISALAIVKQGFKCTQVIK
jgi:hypothetical protein